MLVGYTDAYYIFNIHENTKTHISEKF